MKGSFTILNLRDLLIVLFLFSLFFLNSATSYSQETTILQEDWESGIGNWSASNGVWEVGIPTVGPDSGHSGQNCAGTILNGNYPGGSNTRLESPISPVISLPSLSSGEKIQLKFWHWFRNSDDKGDVQISVNGGEWNTISNPSFDGTSNLWTQYVADLSSYADSTIRIGFKFTSGTYNSDNGWYIDDILIERKVVSFDNNNPEDFELGVGDWSADNGLWQVGIPQVGPDNSYSIPNCAGIVLDGNYPGGANTRLISPPILLPMISSTEKIQLKFWHWYINSDDKGYVQISVNRSEWRTISDPSFDGTSNLWTQYIADLSAYADSTVRIGFYFTSGTYNAHNGWYIDDVLIETKFVSFNNPEDFELGVDDWSADNGIWQIGIPTVGPANTHSGQNCAGTILDNNYPGGSNTRLISPEIELIPLQGEIPVLYFWHWFRLSDDKGEVQISVNKGAWQTISGPFRGTSPVWSQAPGVDLSAFADSTIRIAFYFTSGTYNSDNGWYIDDIRIEGVTPTEIGEIKTDLPKQIILYQNYPNPFNPTTQFRFDLPKAAEVSIVIYNRLGQKVAEILNTLKPAGAHFVDFDGSNFSSGLYFYQIRTLHFKQVNKMLLLK